ncbi:uncharacterized protein DS421_15g507760 [Arachis hypogaea]|nr:uncharacterized protein DS421_15g507760 [Arachis hypogaea]
MNPCKLASRRHNHHRFILSIFFFNLRWNTYFFNKLVVPTTFSSENAIAVVAKESNIFDHSISLYTSNDTNQVSSILQRELFKLPQAIANEIEIERSISSVVCHNGEIHALHGLVVEIIE